MATRLSGFINRNTYTLLILGGVLDAVTTWVAIHLLGGWEFNPVMAYGFLTMGMIPALLFKMAVTAEGGRVLLTYAPNAVRLLAAGFWAVGMWNLTGSILTILVA
jgi:uncharacterized membrane protein